jgi:hypothetical protein
MVTVFLASVGAVSVASAQVDNTPHSYDTTLIITGNGQVTQPGKPIVIFGHIFSGGVRGPAVFPYGALTGMTVKVYAQRTISVLGREIGRFPNPELVATVKDWGNPTQKTFVSFKQPGDYYVYATFEGAVGADSNYYRPSQSEKVAVKVTNRQTLPFSQKPTLIFATTSADHQVAFVGDSFRVGGELLTFVPSIRGVVRETISIYCQYKSSLSNAWGRPELIGTTIVPGGAWYTFDYKPTQPGYYRFQAKFAGDPMWQRGGYDASASNYVDVQVKTPTPEEKTKLTLDVSKNTPYTGESVTFSGVLQTTASTPVQIAHATIEVRLSKDNVNWEYSLGEYTGDNFAITENNGAYVFSGLFWDPGVYYVRTTFFYGTTEYTQTFSNSVQITVSVPPINPPS